VSQDKASRTEKPTGRQLNKARDKGNVSRSADVGHAVSLAVFLLWTSLAGGAFMAALAGGLRSGLVRAAHPATDAALLDALLDSSWQGMAVIGPLVVAIAASAVAAQLLQTGWHLKKPLFSIDLKKVNPLSGLRGFFSLQKFIAALKALLKIAIYGTLAAVVVVPEWHRLLDLGLGTPGDIFRETCGIAFRVLVRALLISGVIAVADFAINKRIWYRNLYMTKQQIRDEHRENEGDPMIKGRIRSRMREGFRRRMMSAVKTVALKYDRLKMLAPVVVAKGRGFIALRIKEEAKLHRVPVLEDPPLARTLEKLCPLGAAVPPALYRAVAEVFAYVFGRRRGPYRIHREVETTAASEGMTP
jgi:flagellar biosynthetic protein FlhB